MSIVREFVVGHSVEGVPLLAWQVGQSGEAILFLGGIHGDEPESVDLAMELKAYFTRQAVLFDGKILLIVPVVNPDGYRKKSRVNANGVDLNRNFPAKNWTKTHSQKKYFPGDRPNSEPEVQAIVKLIQDFPPKKIISIHSLMPHQINFDGPAKGLAEAMAKHNAYPVTETIGYATPGSLGAYAGAEKRIPVITYELPEKISLEQAWKESLEAMLEAVRFET